MACQFGNKTNSRVNRKLLICVQFFVVKGGGRGDIKYKTYEKPDFDTGDIPTVIISIKAGLFIEQLPFITQFKVLYRHSALKSKYHCDFCFYYHFIPAIFSSINLTDQRCVAATVFLYIPNLCFYPDIHFNVLYVFNKDSISIQYVLLCRYATVKAIMPLKISLYIFKTVQKIKLHHCHKHNCSKDFFVYCSTMSNMEVCPCNHV